MKKRLFGALVVMVLALSMMMLVACGGGGDTKPTDNGTNNVNQLAVVQNVKYDEDSYKITWDKVTDADSYHVKVTTDNVTFEGIKVNELEFYPQNADKKLSIEVQAVDSTGVMDNSKWSTAYAYTLTKTDTLLSNIMDYAKDNNNGSLKKFISATTEIDEDYNTYIVTLKFIATYDNNDVLTLVRARVPKNTDATSLNEIVKSDLTRIELLDYNLAVDKNGKPINSMNSLLASDITSTHLHKNYISKGYTADVVSSYTSINKKHDKVGKNFTVHAVLKLTRGTDIKYVTFECGVSLGENATSSLEDNVTNGFSREHYLAEREVQLLTGDFAEAAKLSNDTIK